MLLSLHLLVMFSFLSFSFYFIVFLSYSTISLLFLHLLVLSLSNSYSKIVRVFKYKDPLFFFIVSQSLPFYSLFLTYLCIRLRLLPVLFIRCHVFSLFTFFFCSPIAACQANCPGVVAICVTRRIASVWLSDENIRGDIPWLCSATAFFSHRIENQGHVSLMFPRVCNTWFSL